MDEYLKQLLDEIQRIKSKGGKSLYRINDKITDKIAKVTKDYFTKTPGYTIEMRKCKQCINQWDIIIFF